MELYNSSSHNMSDPSWLGCLGSYCLILPWVWSLHEVVTHRVRGTQDCHQRADCLFCYGGGEAIFKWYKYDKREMLFFFSHKLNLSTNWNFSVARFPLFYMGCKMIVHGFIKMTYFVIFFSIITRCLPSASIAIF